MGVQSGYSRGTVGYSRGTAGGTVRLQQVYSGVQQGVQSGYSRGTLRYSGGGGGGGGGPYFIG